MFEGKGVSECSLNTWRAKIKISNTRTHGIFEYSEFLVFETMENFQNLNKNSLRSTIQNCNSFSRFSIDHSPVSLHPLSSIRRQTVRLCSECGKIRIWLAKIAGTNRCDTTVDVSVFPASTWKQSPP